MAGYMEEEQKRGQSPSPNTESGGVSSRTRARPTPKRAKNAKDGGMDMEVGGGSDEVKTEMKQEIAAGNGGGGVSSSSTSAEKPPQLMPISPTKPQQQPQLPQPQHVIVSPSKRVVVSSSSSSTRVYHTQPALKRDELELIEREMDKHDQYDEFEHDEPSDEEEEHIINGESPQRYMLDMGDPDDEDYLAHSGGSSTGRGRGRGGVGRGRGRGGGRGSRGGGTGTGVMRGTGIRGRPRGSRGGGSGSGGIMRGGGTMRAPRMPMFKSSAPHLSRGGIYSLQPAGGIVGELSARTIPAGGQPHQSFVRVLRPAGVPIQGNYPMRSTVLSQQQQMAETNFVINRELENYRGRIVEGTSVREFNEIIDNFLAEYQRLVDDRAQLISGHREYVNHLKLSHQAAQDIKDNKIRYLEQQLDQLQQKLVTGFKQDQLRVVKHGTIEGGPDGQQREAGGGDEDQPQIGGIANQQQQGIQQVIVGGNGQIMEHQDTEMMEGGGQQNANRSWQGGNGPVGGGDGGQRLRILGLGGGRQMAPQQQIGGHPENHQRMVVGPNAPYFDDEMDDEEEFEDDGGDSAEMDDELGAQVTI